MGKAILKVFAKNLDGSSYQVFLFGSRTDDQKKGGDIDLLLVVPESDFASAKQKKSLLKFDLEEACGDQRVDLTIATDQSLNDDMFLSSIKNDLIEIRGSLQINSNNHQCP